MSQPYTYRVKFIPTGEYYYGVRYSKNCKPSDLWVTYFTSSNKVMKLINEHGKESFDIEVRRIFDTKEQAIQWEERVTRRVIYWPNYLNANSGKAFNHSKSVNGGLVAVNRGTGIHAMSSVEKAVAGRKGGLSLARRKLESGLTDNEKDGHVIRASKISVRRLSGNWTQKEIDANKKTQERRSAGDWTNNERNAYAKLAERRKAGEWTDQELLGFKKTSESRKAGRWITDGTRNKFVSTEPPLGWSYGFIRKKKGA